MVNLEWPVPHTIVSPRGSIDLNVTDPYTGRRWQILPAGYQIVPSLRVTQDNISQADGAVLHPRYKTGLVATFQIRPQIMTDLTGETTDYTDACGQDLREMGEELALVLNDLRDYGTDPNTQQRLLWTPTGYGDRRMLTEIELLSWPDPTFDNTETIMAFALETPFPYGIDATEIDTDISDGASSGADVENAGNADQSPVIRIHGPATVVTIANADDLDLQGNPLQVKYDSGLPGGDPIPGGHYVELDFFRGSATLSGGSGTNVIASVDPRYTDFFHLVPGANNLTAIGADITVLSNNAWA